MLLVCLAFGDASKTSILSSTRLATVLTANRSNPYSQLDSSMTPSLHKSTHILHSKDTPTVDTPFWTSFRWPYPTTTPQDSGQHSADNLQLPLENGTVNEKGKINISEEVNRTTIWKQVNNCNVLFTKKQTPAADRQKQLSKSSEAEKRLSTMREEDEVPADEAGRQLSQQKKTQV